MDYIKKNKYPNLKTSGVYPDIDNNQMIGLDNDELEKFSLGNWNSIVKTNRVFTSNHLTKFTATFDDEQAVEEIPITFLPFNIPYGGGDSSGNPLYPEHTLSNRFFVEFYGWYLDTSILHEAGFHLTGYETIGEITIPPTPFNIDSLPDLEGTFDTYTPKLPSGFLYFKEDVITKNIIHPYGIDLSTFFNNLEIPTVGDFLGSEGLGTSENSDIDLNISNNWSELVNSGVVSQEYADAFKSAFKFHNWSYEVHNEINRGGMSSQDVYSHFPTVTTYEEGYRWSHGYPSGVTSGAQLGNFFPIELMDSGDGDYANPFNTLDGTEAYIEKLNGEKQRIKNASFDAGNSSSNPVTFCDVDDPEATPNIFSDNGIEYDIGQPEVISYMEAAGTQLRLWLIANTFFIKENPDGSEDYGQFGSNNPIKISFGQTNEEELNQLLNYSLVVNDCILDSDICNFAPEGLNNLTYYGKDFELNGEIQKYTSNYANQYQRYTDRTSCSMRITPIFDRPKKYYGINKVYTTPSEYLPDNYESNPQVPSKFIIEQHPEGNKFFDSSTYANDYNSNVGQEYPYGHLFGKNVFNNTGDPPGILDFNGLYVDQDFYRRPSYTAVFPLTFEDTGIALELESNNDFFGMTLQLLKKPIFVIDDRDDERDENGLISFNAYIPNLVDGLINTNGVDIDNYTWHYSFSYISYNGLMGFGQDEEDEEARNDYLIDTLGWPQMPWPPILESGEEADIDTIFNLTRQYNTLVSSLTTLENESDIPSAAKESGFLTDEFFENEQKLEIGDYDVSNVDFIVDTFFATNVGDTISRNNSGVEIKSRFLYYDKSDPEFVNSSYPIKLNLVIGLLDYDDFSNEEKIIDLDELEQARQTLLSSQDNSPLSNYFKNTIAEAASSPEKSIYRAQVIQWGDEETLLDDDAILNSYFFSMYQQEEWPSIFNYGYKKHRSDQENNARPIMYVDNNGDTIFNVFSHNYTTPGTKTIKIIVYRYNSDYTFLIGTSLVTKNVVINDGLITAQDYTVQGGTNFNFLPLKSKSLLVNSGSDFLELDIPKEAILGGLNKQSEYNASVNQIKKDDNFIEEDYLLRSSVNQYVDKMQIDFYGESINNSDLSQFRFFNKPKTIYDFIGGNKLEWITIGSGSLPLNSLATDIFISDDNCLIDLNPSDVVYSTIQNKAGIDGKGILIGDFKLNQPEDGLIEQETLMDLPKINSETNKQAF